MVVLACVGLAVRVWAIWIKGPSVTHDGAFRPWLAPNAWLPGYLDWFAFGMLLAVASAWVATGGVLPRAVRWWARHAGTAWSMGFGAYAFVALTATFPPPGHPNPPMTQMIVTTVFPLAAALIVLPVALDPFGGGLRRVLRSRPLVMIGAISYGIYLWHLTAIQWTREWIANGSIPRSALLQAFLVVGITALAATFSFVVVERPLMRWSARLAYKSRTLTAST
jgi:peptidoglycan/LPS O-acetylase OafA/YrhL